jgi:beta-glucanase (GH16 family)
MGNNRFVKVISLMLFTFIPLFVSGLALTTTHTIFREDFDSERPSIFKWGMPTFTLYNFKGDPEMVLNSTGINYLKLGLSESDIYPSGFIYTKNRFSYGSYSARIRVSDVPGAVASFFACNEIASVFSDGTHDEIDFEFLTAKPHAVLMTTWYMATGMEGGEQTLTHNFFLYEDPSFDIRKWHIYRFEWYPEKVVFYIDNKEVWTSTRAIPKRDMQIALHIYTISSWKEVQFPPKGEIYQMTDWVEYKKLKSETQEMKD